MSKRFLNLIFTFFLFVFLAFIWVRFVVPNLLEVEEVSLGFDNFPEEEMRIVHLTDLHSYRFGDKERRILEKVGSLNPDLVLITGDLVNWRGVDGEDCFVFWEELAKVAPGKVYVVWGNHDHRYHQFDALSSLVRKSGMKVLENEGVSLEWGGDRIWLIGVDDPHLGYDDSDEAFEEVPDEGFKVLLAHSPEIVRKVEGYDLDLILAGHTHGCQVKLPIVCNLILPLRYDKQFKNGLFDLGGRFLYVGRGTGESFLPIRFRSRPEVTLIRLSREEQR